MAIGSARKRGLLKLAGWGVLAAAIILAIAWANVHWQRVPGGVSMLTIGVPGALALTGLLEVITGRPFGTLASQWDALAGWQRGVIGLLVVAVASLAAMGAIILFG